MGEINTEGKSIWELHIENFVIPLWEELERPISFDDEECEEEKPNGYYVDPNLLKGL
tara:strand:- start:30 stop:200 length:171 start_codon:yes stop_codon:yes gene_type:complete